jgi:plastocyanin
MRTIGLALSTVLLLMALAACTVSTEDADDDTAVADATETPVMDSQPTDDADDATEDDSVTEDAVDDSTADDSVRDDEDEQDDQADDAADDTARDDEETDDAADDSVTDDDEVAEPQEHVIEIVEGNQFSPEEITIAPGDTVTWVNLTDQVHTSSADPEIANDPNYVQLPDGAEPWHSGNIEPDGEYSVTLDVPGAYVYFCYPHQDAGMIGRIIVEDPDDEAEQDDATTVDDEADDASTVDDDTTDVDAEPDDDMADDGTDDTDDTEHTGVGGDREYTGKDSVN